MDLLKKGQYLGQTFGSYQNNDFLIKGSLHNQNECDYHKHSRSYLSVLLSGGYVEISDFMNKTILPGSLIFRSKNYIHKNIFIDQRTKCLNVEFNDEWFKKNDIDKVSDIPVLNTVGNFTFLFQMITDFILFNNVDIAEDILVDFVKQIHSTSFFTRTTWLSKLIKILDKEINTTHSLKSLSERVCVHPNYMARIFKSKLGISIGQYQINKKLSIASSYLLTTKKSILDVAICSGFYDESHFIRTFKSKSGGFSPTKFRKIVNG